jgi:hypothetical protein
MNSCTTGTFEQCAHGLGISLHHDSADSNDLDGETDVWGWTKHLIIQHNGMYKPWFQLATRHKLVCLDKSQICRDLGAIQKNQVADPAVHLQCTLHTVPERTLPRL